MNDSQHTKFLNRLENEGERREFEVVIRGTEKIQLTSEEISEALYEKVNTKAEALVGDKPHFDVEVSTHAFSVLAK
jgi:hypothetical protein